jgi:hypothetical protein
VHEGDAEQWSIYLVPSSNVLAVPLESGSTNYHPVFGRARTLLRRLATRVEPFPAPVLTGATVDGRTVSGDPSTYLQLFDAESAGAAITGDEEWLPIELASRTKSPWTNDAVYVAYSPSAKLLRRGTETIRLPDRLAADVEAARALGDGGAGVPWLLVAGLAAAAGAVAAAFAGLRRVRRRRLAALGVAAVAAALALPGVASAKGYGPVQLCGPAACSSLSGWLASLPAYELTGAPPAAPFYDLGPHRRGFSTGWYVPSARVEAPRAGASFTRVTQDAAAVLDRLARQVQPFPAPTVVAAFVGDKRVTGDASTYLRLFELSGPAPAASGGADWVPISLVSERDTPWTNGATYLLYSPSQNLLQNGRELIRVDDRTAARLDRAEALGEDGRRLLPWLVLGLLVVSVLLLAAAGAAGRRRASVPATARPLGRSGALFIRVSL